MTNQNYINHKLFKINDLNRLKAQGAQILGQLHNSVILLQGDLGSGKTTLVKVLLKLLGVEGNVTSPTFSIINEYKGHNLRIAHMDLYRLNHVEEAIEIGIEDYLFEYDFCFIEWPEIIRDLLPSKCQKIEIDIDQNDGSRDLKITTIINE